MAASLVASVAVTPAAQGATKQKVCIALDTAGINERVCILNQIRTSKIKC
jgi:hypothetical protein